MSKFILRVDDICPTMDWKKFARIELILDRYNIKPIIGVIPNNKDPKLEIDPPKNDFWQYINHKFIMGWSVALHGYEHICNVNDGGLLNINSSGEFAGKTYDQQILMIKKGLEIFKKNGIETNIFMAPRHSFDLNTLKALRLMDFKYVTDGFSLFPYKLNGIKFIPQLFSTPKHFGFGVYTICLHTNHMTERQFFKIESFIKKQNHNFISLIEVEQFESYTLNKLSPLFLIIVKIVRRIKSKLRKFF